MANAEIGNLFDEVERLRSELRSYEHESIYEPWILLSERQRNLLFAALDLLADTRDAVWVFLRDHSWADRNLSHLHIYGMLNALSLWQDAVLTCCGVFGFPTKSLKEDADFKYVRKTRVEAAGHPSDIKKDTVGPHRIASVSPGQIESDSFQYRTYETETGKAQQFQVKYDDLVRRHLTWTSMALEGLLKPIRHKRDLHAKAKSVDGAKK